MPQVTPSYGIFLQEIPDKIGIPRPMLSGCLPTLEMEIEPCFWCSGLGLFARDEFRVCYSVSVHKTGPSVRGRRQVNRWITSSLGRRRLWCRILYSGRYDGRLWRLTEFRGTVMTRAAVFMFDQYSRRFVKHTKHTHTHTHTHTQRLNANRPHAIKWCKQNTTYFIV